MSSLAYSVDEQFDAKACYKDKIFTKKITAGTCGAIVNTIGAPLLYYGGTEMSKDSASDAAPLIVGLALTFWGNIINYAHYTAVSDYRKIIKIFDQIDELNMDEENQIVLNEDTGEELNKFVKSVLKKLEIDEENENDVMNIIQLIRESRFDNSLCDDDGNVEVDSLRMFRNNIAYKLKMSTFPDKLYPQEAFSGDSENSETCPICLCEFEEGEMVTRTKHCCKKLYHPECLKRAYKENHDCPTCRHDLSQPKVEETINPLEVIID
tara:strand:+ start:6010 stop:6807 length:798 start_codon:yes stop_codon:yes gene_type:complete